MAVTNQVGSVLQQYAGNPRIGGRKAMLLYTMLTRVAPPLTPAQKRRLARVKAEAVEVEDVINARERTSPGRLQAPRFAFANAWSALFGVLDSGARLPSELNEHGVLYAELRDTLFVDGIAFVRYDAIEACAFGRRLLGRMHDEGLEARIDALVGGHFLASVRKATDALSGAVGAGKEVPESTSSTALIEAVARFQAAIGAYTRSLLAEVEENDHASLARFLAAVAPIDEMRSTRTIEEEVEEETAAPAVAPVVPVVTNTGVNSAVAVPDRSAVSEN